MTEWRGMPVPRLLSSLLCEDAASSVGLGDGRVSLQRVFFVLYADAFPAGFDRMVVANFWFGSAGQYVEKVRITAPDGTVVAEGESELNLTDDPVVMTQLFYFPTMVLPEPGEYTVDVLLDDASVNTHTLRVVDLRPELPEAEEAEESIDNG